MNEQQKLAAIFIQVLKATVVKSNPALAEEIVATLITYTFVWHKNIVLEYMERIEKETKYKKSRVSGPGAAGWAVAMNRISGEIKKIKEELG